MNCKDCGAPMQLSRSKDTVFIIVCSKERSHRSLHAPDDLVKAVQKVVGDFDTNDERHKKIDEMNVRAAQIVREEGIDNGADVARLAEAIEKAQFNYYRSMTTQQACEFLAVKRRTLLDYVAQGNLPHHKIGKSYTFTMQDLINFRNVFREPKPKLK